MPKNEGPRPAGGSTAGTTYRPANRIQEVTRPTSGSEQAERVRIERAGQTATTKKGANR